MNDFTFHVDLQKSEDSDSKVRHVEGLASAEVQDAQGEVVLQKGMDLAPLLKSGWVNWDHKDREGPEYLIGEPVSAEIVRIEEHPRLKKSGLSGLGLYFKALLYNTPGLEKAQAVWAHLNNPERTRPLAWSIQGRSYERDGNRITKSELRHMAITHQPVQRVSFAEVCKSLTTGMISPLLLENLDRRVTSVLWGDSAESCGHLKKSGRFIGGRRGALEHVTKCQGMSVPEGAAYLRAMIKSGIAH